jgi:hypothetical protein
MPLMPWQRLVVDTALEVDDEGTPIYSQVTVQVPRQSGKSSLVLALMVHRALLWGGRQSIAYNAQDLKSSRAKMLVDYAPVIEASPIKTALRRIYLGNGAESIVFRNLSRIDTFAKTASAAHGRTLDLAIIDEARFDFDDSREAAYSPAMVTRKDSQLWILSVAGDAASVYFRKKVEDGRRLVSDKTQSSRAFFDWSAPDDSDWTDPDVWAKTIPSLGYTQTEKAIKQRFETALADGKENTFRQEYLCQWMAIENAMIPDRYLVPCLDPATAPSGRICFGIDVALDRSSGAICVADETGRVELIDARDGVTWIVDRALDLYRKHRAPLVVDGYSPANSLVDRLEAGGVPVVRYALRDMTAAVGSFYDAILEGNIRIRPDQHLEAALRTAKKKQVASGWLWSRTDVDVDISPLFAATLAYYHATNRRAPESRRSTIF